MNYQYRLNFFQLFNGYNTSDIHLNYTYTSTYTFAFLFEFHSFNILQPYIIYSKTQIKKKKRSWVVLNYPQMISYNMKYSTFSIYAWNSNSRNIQLQNKNRKKNFRWWKVGYYYQLLKSGMAIFLRNPTVSLLFCDIQTWWTRKKISI